MSTGYSFCGWRTRVTLVLLALTGTVGAFAGSALADDPPITTVPTPTVPTPEPAPTPIPPAKKPAPKQSTPAPRPAPRTPVTPSPSPGPAVVTPSAPVHPQTQSKPKKKAAQRTHRKKKIKKTVTSRPLPTPDLQSGAPVGAAAGLLPAAPGTKGGGSFNVSGLFVILGCALAILCFSIAMVPATAVPWRGVAGFIAERQLDLTLTGLTLLVAVLAFYFLAGA